MGEGIPRGSENNDQDDSEFGESPEQKKQAILDETQRSVDLLASEIKPLETVGATVKEAFHCDPDPFTYHRLPELFAPDLVLEAGNLFKEVRDIVHEKGFRYGPSVITGGEHAKIGSSGYSKFEKEDPDVPVPLLEPRMTAEGKIQPPEDTPLTFKEVDKARRLAGMTILDPATQRITKEIDPIAKNDSYHFLSSERKKEIQKREVEILDRLSILAQESLKKFEQVKNIVKDIKKYIEGTLTSPEMGARSAAINNLVSERIRQQSRFDLTPQIKEAKTLSFETGRRDKILTPQEIKLRVGGQVAPQYEGSPYRPLAVQDGASIQEVGDLRSGEATMVVTNEGVMVYAMPWGFKLEELDANGNTLKSPTILSRDSLESVEDSLKSNERFKDEIKIPFARPNDWFYKPPEV